MKIDRKPEAQEDILQIGAHIGRDSPRAAERMLNRINAAIEMLRDHPEMGPRRDDLRPGLRMLTVRPYLAFYRIGEGGIEIVRVLHGTPGLGDEM